MTKTKPCYTCNVGIMKMKSLKGRIFNYLHKNLVFDKDLEVLTCDNPDCNDIVLGGNLTEIVDKILMNAHLNQILSDPKRTFSSDEMLTLVDEIKKLTNVLTKIKNLHQPHTDSSGQQYSFCSGCKNEVNCSTTKILTEYYQTNS